MGALSLVQRYKFFDGNLPAVRREHRRLLLNTWFAGVVCGISAVILACHTWGNGPTFDAFP